MFRPTFRGKVYGDKEFTSIKEARNWCANDLQRKEWGDPNAQTIEDWLKLKIKGVRVIGVVGKREPYYKTNVRVERECVVCGKKFMVSSDSSLQITCSQECRKKHLYQYNAEYVRNRMKTDKDFARKKAEKNLACNKKLYVVKRRKEMEELADKIMLLSSQENGRELVSLFLLRYTTKRVGKFYKDISDEDKKNFEIVKELTGDFKDDKIEDIKG